MTKTCPSCKHVVVRQFGILDRIGMLIPVHYSGAVKYRCLACRNVYVGRKTMVDYALTAAFTITIAALRTSWWVGFLGIFLWFAGLAFMRKDIRDGPINHCIGMAILGFLWIILLGPHLSRRHGGNLTAVTLFFAMPIVGLFLGRLDERLRPDLTDTDILTYENVNDP